MTGDTATPGQSARAALARHLGRADREAANAQALLRIALDAMAESESMQGLHAVALLREAFARAQTARDNITEAATDAGRL